MANFSGIWKSSYKFYDDRRNGSYWSEHYVQIRQANNTLIIESVPSVNDAYLFIRLHIDGDLATGSWQEQTSKQGFFTGAVFVGALQLVISEDKKRMSGKWVAFGPNMKVNSNEWELTYIGEALPEGTGKIITERPADD